MSISLSLIPAPKRSGWTWTRDAREAFDGIGNEADDVDERTLEFTDREESGWRRHLEPEVGDALPRGAGMTLDEVYGRILVRPARPGEEAAEEDDPPSLFEARRWVEHVDVCREHVDGHPGLLSGEGRLFLGDAEDDVGAVDPLQLELSQPASLVASRFSKRRKASASMS